MIKKIISTLTCVLITILLAGCFKKKEERVSSKPRAVATTAMIAEIVERVAQDKFEVECLIKGDIDPHSYELVKGDLAKLKKADVIFYQGLGLEHGSTLVEFLKSNPKAIAVGDVLISNHAGELIYQDGFLDPHVWLDLDLWQKIIPAVQERLTSISPADKEVFEANALKLTSDMSELDAKIKTLLQEIPEQKRYLVTSHSAFSYFAKRYLAQGEEWQRRLIAPEGLAPEAQISLYDIEKVVSFINAHNVDIIFSESNVSKDALGKILDVCKKMGRDVKISQKPLFGDALFDEKSYLDMMWHNATLLHQAWHENIVSENQQP